MHDLDLAQTESTFLFVNWQISIAMPIASLWDCVGFCSTFSGHGVAGKLDLDQDVTASYRRRRSWFGEHLAAAVVADVRRRPVA